MSGRPVKSRVLGTLLIAAMGLAAAPLATAGMLSVEGAIANFTFDDGEVVYDFPPLGDAKLTLTSGNAVRLELVDVDGRESNLTEGDFSARLKLDATLHGGSVVGGNFLIYGTLPTASETEMVELVGGTLDAMGLDSANDTFGFLFSGTAATGQLAVQYQSIGLFTRIAGIDEVEWVRQFKSSNSLLNLVGNESQSNGVAAAGGSIPAAPAPSTPFLLAAGIVAVWLRRQFGARG